MADSPDTEAVTCKAWGAVPLVGSTESQAESLAAVKLSVPPPPLVTFSEAGVGSDPPWLALNDKLDGETERTGWVEALPEP